MGYQKAQPVTFEPIVTKRGSPFGSKNAGLKNGDKASSVTVLDLGTSANVLGYSGGTRMILWADDDLNCVINFHRMGTGSAPPGLLIMPIPQNIYDGKISILTLTSPTDLRLPKTA